MSEISTTPRPLLPAEWSLVEVRPTVQAGFPSPAEDHSEKRIDLYEILVRHPVATFIKRVAGQSMREAGIDHGDTLIVDRAIKPAHGHIVIAVVDGDFTVKQLHQRGGVVKLRAANPTYPDIILSEGQTLEVWGVVTWILKRAPV